MISIQNNEKLAVARLPSDQHKKKTVPFLFAMIFCLSAMFATQARAQGYETITPAQNTSVTDKVEVLEFFWFGCPHCSPLNPSWESHSRAFYAAQILGISDEFVPAMFNAIHKDRKPMRKPAAIAELAESFGVSKKDFTEAMGSFGVQTRMARAMQLARGAQITGVPAIIVNGKYRISSGSAGSHEGMIGAINQTVTTEKSVMGLE